MSKKKKNKNKQSGREIYDIQQIQSFINRNCIEEEPAIYNGERMSIYGANINLRRFILEIKDGLTPVMRRLLMTLYSMGLFNGKLTKSAQAIGEVLKLYHPHGDTSAYSSMVNMGQVWRNNITLVNNTSNYGSAYEPGGYAQYRYTDCGLSDFAYDCFFKEWGLKDYKNDMTVDWTDNYDGSRKEPIYLPEKYPLFLLNWHRAIGYGRYTCTPGFNLIEAFEAVIKLIEDENAKFDIYPDDPKGCNIINKKDIKNLLDKSEIKVKVRSKYEVKHYDGHDHIEITSIPFEVSPTTVKDAIIKIAEKGNLPELLDIDGHSTDYGKSFRLILKVKKGYDPDALMNKLYKNTQLEMTFATKYAFVNGTESVDYTLRIAILEWVRYRRQTIERMNKIKRINILKRIHFLVPLIKVLESGEIDSFISIIRKNTGAEAIKKIMKKFDLTDYQAEKIVGVKLSDLSIDKHDDYVAELKELKKEDERLAEICSSKKKIDKIIVKQLREGIEKYGVPRKSVVMQLIDHIQIPDTEHFLIFTNKYVKKLPYDEKGYRIGRVDNGEKVIKVMTVNNRDKIAIFTKDGKCLPIEVNDIGNSGLQSVGISYIQLGAKDNRFVDAIFMNDDNIGRYITSITEEGLISKTLYDEIVEKKKVFAFMKLGKTDSVSGIAMSDKKDELLIYTKLGNCALFNFNDFETTSLNTKGVQSAKLKDDDRIIGVISFNKKAKSLLTLTDRGYGKKIDIDKLPSTKRAGKTIEINAANGNLISIVPISTTDPIFITTTAGVLQLDTENIKTSSRIGKNTRFVELKASDYAFGLD